MLDFASIIIILGSISIVTGGVVAVLRPVTKRIGLLFDAMALERQERASLARNSQLERIVEAQGERLQLLEQRLQFTEGLLDKGRF